MWLLYSRSSHTAAITKTITITTQRGCILLVELLHAEYAHAHSTKRMRSLCVVIVIFFVITAVLLGLNSNKSLHTHVYYKQ